jgi:cytoskeleton protein RodZ
MTPTPFGEHLKRERELRGVSLDEIAAATRIKTSFLDALENGRWEELPGGAFNRGFVRATARFLGLDEDGMVSEYAIETGSVSQSKPAVVPSGALPRDYRPAVIAICVVLVLAVGGGWFGYHAYALHKQKRAPTAAADSAVPTRAEASSSSSAGSDSGGIAVAGNANNSPLPAASGVTSGPTSAAPLAPVVAPNATPETLKLKIEARKRTDVKIVGDGKVLFKGRLHSDDPKSFEARDGFEVTAGDASVVQLELNDRSIPFGSTTGHHATVSIGRKDLKPAIETPR